MISWCIVKIACPRCGALSFIAYPYWEEDRSGFGERTLNEEGIMKRKVTIKPRDLNVPAMLKRSSGAHGKTYKAMRRSVKIELAKRLPDVQMGSELNCYLSEHPYGSRIGPVAQW
jgi:hypothetical protein